jgi:hypothetical protein
MATLSDFVDIGGECFNVTGANAVVSPTERNNTKTYDLICKSSTEFYNTFRSIIAEFPDTLRLFRTYLPYQLPQLQGIQEYEKVLLKSIIQKRIDSLAISMENSKKTSIKNGQFFNYHRDLKKLLKEIDAAEGTPSVTSLDDLKKRVKDKFSKEKVYYVLMELAWYLLHPDQIKSNSDSWVKLLDTVEKLNLGELVKSIHKSDRHTMQIDVNRVNDATILDAALSVPDDSAELKQRLESILQLFVTRKYLKKIDKNTKGPVVNINDLSGKLSESMKGGADNTNENAVSSPVNHTNSKNATNSFKINRESMANMMKPFYEFFKQKYAPITDALSKELPDGLSLVSLSKLLFICQKITSQEPIQHGIYRLTHTDDSVVAFLRTQLGTVQAHVKEMEANGKEIKPFIEMAGIVPLVSIKTLLNRHGNSGHYTDPDNLPIVRFMIKGINLEPNEMEFDDTDIKEKFDNAIQQIFTDDAIYLVCNTASSTQTPMNIYDIDYSTVNVSKDTWVATEQTGYFKDKKPEMMLETAMKVNPNIIFNHGMLALSMFIASEELLPK